MVLAVLSVVTVIPAGEVVELEVPLQPTVAEVAEPP